VKKVLLTIIVVLAMSTMATAGETPYDEGTIAIGGQLSPGMGFDGISLNVVPEISYFLSPNIAMGGSFMFESMSSDGDNATIFGIGPIFGYYFNTDKNAITGSLYPFIKAKLAYLSLSSDGNSSTFLVIGFEGGMSYMLSEKIGLNFGAHLRTSDMDSDNNVTTIGVSAGFSAFIN